jgi:hypothetical protein
MSPLSAFLPCARHRRRAGIGLAISAALSKAGAAVTVLGRNRATLDEAVASGAAQFAAVADVADPASVKSAVAEAAARQPIDILVANAGAAESSPFGRSDAALFQRMMDVNFMGVVHATQAVLPGMLERRRGRIVAVASTAGLKGYAYVSAYSAANTPSSALSVRWRWKPQRAASPSTPSAPASPKPICWKARSTTSSRRPAAAASRPSPNCQSTIRRGALWRPRKSLTPCSGSAAKAPPPSRGRPLRLPAAKSDRPPHR